MAGELNFAVTADNQDFLQKMRESRNEIDHFKNVVQNSGQNIDDVLRSITGKLQAVGKVVTGAFAIDKAFDFAKQCGNVRAEIESLEISFRTLLGSKEKADAMLGEIRKFAATTPMDLSTLAQGAQTMLAFNIEGEKVMPMLRAIGDISKGDAQKFNSLSLAFSQMSATGKLMGQDLLQMINAGFNPLAEISTATGKSIGELKEEMEKGAISTDMVTQAFISATSEGGKFHGMLEKQAKGLKGSFAYLRGAFTDMMNDIGGSTEGVTVTATNMAASLVKNYKTVAETIGVLIAIYGSYKAAMIVTAATAEAAAATEAAARTSAMSQAIATETAALNSLMPQKEAEKTTTMQQAVAAGYLSEAKMGEIVALRAEAAAYVESLTIKAKEAAATQANALIELQSSEARRLAATEAVNAAEAKYIATLKCGDASAIAAARTEYETAQDVLNTANKEVNTAATEYNAASKAKEATASAASAAQKQLDTISTAANTAQEQANVVSTNILTVAKTRLGDAVKRLYATMMANPYGLILATVVALSYATYKLLTYESEQEKMQKRINEATAKCDAQYKQEKESLDALSKVLQSAEKGSAAWCEAKDSIVKQYGKYIDGLEKEIDKTGSLVNVYDKLTEAIQRSVKVRGLADYLKENSKDSEIALKQKELYDDMAERYGEEKAKKLMSQVNVIAEKGLLWTEWRDWFDKDVKSSFAIRIGELEKMRRQERKERNSYMAANGLSEDDYLEAMSGVRVDDKTTKKVKKESEYTKKDWEKFKKEKEAEWDKMTKEQMNSAEGAKVKADIRRAEKVLEGMTLSTTKSIAKEAKDRASALKDVQQTELELRRSHEQAVISTMKEGSEKRIEEINHQANLEKDALKKQTQELADKNKKAGSTGLNENGLTAEQQSLIDKSLEDIIKKQRKDTTEVYKADLAAMRDYLKQYGTYQQQKLAIAEEYAEKISIAQTEGERLTLARQRDAEIQRVDMSAMEQTIDWQAVFGGFTGILEEQLRETLNGLKEYVKTDKFKSSSAEDKKLIYEAMERIQQQLPAENKGTLDFSSITAKMQEFGRVLTEAHEAARADIAAQNALVDAQTAYKQSLETGTVAEQQLAKAALDTAQRTATGTATALNEANAQVEAMGSDLATTSKATVDGLNLVAVGLQQFSSDSLAGVFAGLQNIVNGLDKLNIGGALGDAISKLSSSLSNAGFIGQIISAILSILDVLKDGIGPLISGLIDSILGAVSGILDNILSGDMFVQIFKSIRDGIGNILNTITFGGFGSLMSSSNAKWVAEVTERLTDSNERLRNSVDKLKDEMSGQGGWKAIDTARQAAEDQKKINQQTMEILIAQMRYHGDHGSNASKWNLGKKDYDSINETLAAYARKNGKEASIVNSLEDIFKLTPEEMDYIRTYNIEMWRVMLTRGKYDKSEYWEQYADLAGQLEEITKQLQETLTQTSFDSLRSSFVDSLMDMTADAEDFADNLTEMLMRSVLNARISNELEDEIKAFYEKWAEYAESGSILDDKETKELQEWWKRITDKGLQFRDEAAAITGYDKSSTSSQSATAGYSTQLSEDTGSEIVGRMTAVQDQGYVRNELLTDINEGVSSIAALIQQRISIFEDMQDEFLPKVLECLQDICKHTKNLKDIKQFIEDIKNKIKDI